VGRSFIGVTGREQEDFWKIIRVFEDPLKELGFQRLRRQGEDAPDGDTIAVEARGRWIMSQNRP
jgi:hypothetical protein